MTETDATLSSLSVTYAGDDDAQTAISETTATVDLTADPLAGIDLPNNSVSAVFVTPTASQTDAVIDVTGPRTNAPPRGVVSGEDSYLIAVDEGSNSITVHRSRWDDHEGLRHHRHPPAAQLGVGGAEHRERLQRLRPYRPRLHGPLESYTASDGEERWRVRCGYTRFSSSSAMRYDSRCRSDS